MSGTEGRTSTVFFFFLECLLFITKCDNKLDSPQFREGESPNRELCVEEYNCIFIFSRHIL